ncbi:hypothetical protein B9479_003701 [Cryptococcus floricola]|uniref:Uncharacterized protein n=1 Tax=Cryptococcus floricola TaxID=2591691 RepID=A0A5D3AZ51_9TREE|nr:hypothetical protein B9479_003701 [Cryptococcus floricola]
MSGPSKPQENVNESGQPAQDKTLSPPPAYINTPPRPATEMERNRPGFVVTSRDEERRREVGGSSSGASSETAVNMSNENQGLPKDQSLQGPTKYEQWYPGDASRDGRPAWWNRLEL